jgi:uncharacterized protein YdbL (DUF1318 family)
MKKHLMSMVVIAGLVIAMPAFALDLHQARHDGQVGEKSDGYVAALKSTADVKALVQSVNQKRRQEYARISAANKQSIEVVAKLAAQQIVSTLEPGDQYQDDAGNWKTR